MKGLFSVIQRKYANVWVLEDKVCPLQDFPLKLLENYWLKKGIIHSSVLCGPAYYLFTRRPNLFSRTLTVLINAIIFMFPSDRELNILKNWLKQSHKICVLLNTGCFLYKRASVFVSFNWCHDIQWHQHHRARIGKSRFKCLCNYINLW